MKSRKILIPFCTGIVLGAILFGGVAASAAAGVMAERSTQAVYVDGQRVELEENVDGQMALFLEESKKPHKRQMPEAESSTEDE